MLWILHLGCVGQLLRVVSLITISGTTNFSWEGFFPVAPGGPRVLHSDPWFTGSWASICCINSVCSSISLGVDSCLCCLGTLWEFCLCLTNRSWFLSDTSLDESDRSSLLSLIPPWMPDSSSEITIVSAVTLRWASCNSFRECCGQLWVRHMFCGRTCDELYHFTFYIDRLGIPSGSQPIKLP